MPFSVLGIFTTHQWDECWYHCLQTENRTLWGCPLLVSRPSRERTRFMVQVRSWYTKYSRFLLREEIHSHGSTTSKEHLLLWEANGSCVCSHTVTRAPWSPQPSKARPCSSRASLRLRTSSIWRHGQELRLRLRTSSSWCQGLPGLQWRLRMRPEQLAEHLLGRGFRFGDSTCGSASGRTSVWRRGWGGASESTGRAGGQVRAGGGRARVTRAGGRRPSSSQPSKCLWS